jgi:hypothetical protein
VSFLGCYPSAEHGYRILDSADLEVWRLRFGVGTWFKVSLGPGAADKEYRQRTVRLYIERDLHQSESPFLLISPV